MVILNVEIKAKSRNQGKVRSILKDRGARFVGVDRQIDTYFNVRFGRLKLREGNIENKLIHYVRENKKGPKQSDILLVKTSGNSNLKEALIKSLGVLVVVDKKREIYFLDNVKFHIDEVKYLGFFVEIEAIDENGSIGREELLRQCNYYLGLFDIKESDLLSESYSDMLIPKN